ncbi:MAG: MFS transporter, partial [Kofleriaceae bacterium]
AATGLVIAIGVGTLVGSFVGGLLGQRLFNRRPGYLPLFCAITTIAAVGPMALLISFPAGPSAAAGATAIALVTGLLAGCVISNVNTMMINVNPPERRGAAFALLNLFNDLGRGLGAWLVGTMAASMGRVTAFHLANLLWIPCGLALFALARLLPREQAAVQARLQVMVARERGPVVDPAPKSRAS